MTRFRKCVRAEIASRLVLYEGHPGRDAHAYKLAALRLFASRGPTCVRRRVLLWTLPNGDWRSPQVEYYISRASPLRLTERGAVLEHLTNGLILALAAAQPNIYNRSKWTDSDLAIDHLALFECVHRLLSTSYARFCATYAKGTLAQQYLAAGRRLRAYDQPALLELEDDLASGEGDQEDGGNEGADAAREDAAGHGKEDSAGDATDSAMWAKKNSLDRAMAFQFLHSNSLGWLVLIRMLMEPLRQYLAQQLMRAGAEWELGQRAEAAKTTPDGAQRERYFRVGCEAEGVGDELLLGQLRLFFEEPTLWRVMPPSQHTVAARALAFRCASRLGAAFHRILRSRRQKFPLKMFRLLSRRDGLAEEFVDVPECLLDAWSLELRKTYPTLSGPEFLQVLYTVAYQARADISHIESRHASVRRVLTAGSVQTHAVSLALLSAQWVVQQHRTTRVEISASSKQSNPKAAPAPDRRRRRKTEKGAERSTKRQWQQRAGRGGAWRAWVRLFTSRKQLRDVDLTSVAASYRSAKATHAPDYQRAQDLGLAATQSGRATGAHGFGGSAEQVRRSRRKLLHAQRRMQILAIADTPTATSIAFAAHGVAAGHTVADTLSMAKMGQREAAAAAARAREDRLATLRSFVETATPGAVHAIDRVLPGVAALPVAAEPTSFGKHLSVQVASREQVHQALSWAHHHSQTSGLAKRLEEQWSKLHHTVPDEPAKERTDKAAAKNKCLSAGMCLCKKNGPLIERMAIRFLNYMKLLSRTRRTFKDDLKQGFLVVKILGAPKASDDPFAEQSVFQEQWVHIGHMSFSPYDPTFTIVRPVPDPGEVPPSTERMYFKACHEYVALYHFFSRLQSSARLSASWYRLEESSRPIASFLPQPVPALVLAGFEGGSEQFFPRRLATRQGGARGDPAWGSASDEDLSEGEDAILDEEDDLGAAAAEEEAEPGFVALLDPLMDAFEAPFDFSVFDEDEPPLPAPATPPLPPSVPVGPPPVVDPPPPPSPHEMPARKRARRDAPSMVLAVEFGTITFFESNQNFEARCRLHEDERCTLTRAAHRAAGSTAPAQRGGRPLGLLAAWLSVASMFPDKESHRDPKILRELSGGEGLETRGAARVALRVLLAPRLCSQRRSLRGLQRGTSQALSHEPRSSGRGRFPAAHKGAKLRGGRAARQLCAACLCPICSVAQGQAGACNWRAEGRISATGELGLCTNTTHLVDVELERGTYRRAGATANKSRDIPIGARTVSICFCV